MGLAILNRVVMVNPWVSQVGPVVNKPACQCRRCKKHGFNPWVGKDPLEEGMEIHSSILAWRIPWTEEPDRLGSIGSQRVRQD